LFRTIDSRAQKIEQGELEGFRAHSIRHCLQCGGELPLLFRAGVEYRVAFAPAELREHRPHGLPGLGIRAVVVHPELHLAAVSPQVGDRALHAAPPQRGPGAGEPGPRRNGGGGRFRGHVQDAVKHFAAGAKGAVTRQAGQQGVNRAAAVVLPARLQKGLAVPAQSAKTVRDLQERTGFLRNLQDPPPGLVNEPQQAAAGVKQPAAGSDELFHIRNKHSIRQGLFSFFY
jgi:hypothetical protein